MRSKFLPALISLFGLTAVVADEKSFLKVEKTEIYKVALGKALSKFPEIQSQDLLVRNPEFLRVHCVEQGFIGMPEIESRYGTGYCFAIVGLYDKSTIFHRKIEVHSRCFETEKYQSVEVWYFEDGFVRVGEFNEALSRGEISCNH